jgi:cytochrome-b5 reductase
MSEELRQITFEELESHNKKEDAWIGIHGKVYDVTKWLDKHPVSNYQLKKG